MAGCKPLEMDVRVIRVLTFYLPTKKLIKSFPHLEKAKKIENKF